METTTIKNVRPSRGTTKTINVMNENKALREQVAELEEKLEYTKFLKDDTEKALAAANENIAKKAIEKLEMQQKMKELEDRKDYCEGQMQYQAALVDYYETNFWHKIAERLARIFG